MNFRFDGTIYYKETVIPYTTKSLGITKMGVAGETLKGPAFQPITIGDWGEFQAYFGGTSTEKFRGSKYPKYELPYIAKEFLKKSEQLEVVRTLGLSGVNAGPAWVITATNNIEIDDAYAYTQALGTQTGEPVIGTTPTISGTAQYSNGSFGGVAFSAPGPFIPNANDTPASTISVVDAYLNGDTGIMYWDDNSQDYYDILPNPIRTQYSTIEALETTYNEPFFYAGIDNGITGGKYVLVFRKGSSAWAREIDSQYIHTGYIIIKKSEMSTIFGSTQEYDENYDFVSGNFTLYQYGWSENDNENIDHSVIKATGLAYEYNGKAGKYAVEDPDSEYNNVVIAVIRSRGEHKKAVLTGYDECENPIYTYDSIEYYADSIELKPSSTLTLGDDGCHPGYSSLTGDFTAEASNFGHFNILVNSVKGCTTCADGEYIQKEYSVSLNPSDKNYITKVLGTNPELGDSDIYVEELYDVALEQLILAGEISAINHEVTYYPPVTIVPDHAPVNGFAITPENELSKKHLGKRYIYTNSESKANNIEVHISKDNGTTWGDGEEGIVGHIYTVVNRVNQETGKKEYIYGEYRDSNNKNISMSSGKKHFTEYLTFHQYYRDVVENKGILRNCVKVASDGGIYILKEFSENDTANDGEVVPVTMDFNDYKEQYRYASTPWIVSEIKGSGNNINLHKLFRFHTISDGNNASYEVKVSIENIDPDNETFDVVIRGFGDSDYNQSVLERYRRCNLVPGSPNYLGYMVGTFDETYSAKSAYVTVEINEDDITANSIPCGFLGYPVRNYNGIGIYQVQGGVMSSEVKQPYLKFKTTIDDDVKPKKQYFGMSDLVGIDEDILSYKGVEAYSDEPDYLTPSFHLDARILNGKPTGYENGNWYVEGDAIDSNGNKVKQVVDVDGITGYNWVTVAMTETTSAGIEPRIGVNDTMTGTIYEDKAYRKFTVCFYGGWPIVTSSVSTSIKAVSAR